MAMDSGRIRIARQKAGVSRLRSVVLIIAAAAFVPACVGGGGGTTARGPDPVSQEPAPPQPPQTDAPTVRPPAPPPAPPPPAPPPEPKCAETASFGCLMAEQYDARLEELAAAHRSQAAFANQWGLERIGADRAAARIELIRGAGTAPGAGQTVGLMDSGIDTAHQAFAGKSVTGVIFSGDGDTSGSEFSHGTAVASVIAGNPGASFTASTTAARGVAWGADIAMFSVVTSGDSPTDDYVATPLTSLAARDARDAGRFDRMTGWSGAGRTLDFVNLSLAYSGIIEQYGERDLRDNFGATIAAQAQAGSASKTIFVWGAANDHGDPCEASDFAANPDLCVNGRVVAKSPSVIGGMQARIAELRANTVSVVAIGEDGAIASFSNRCGIAADWCIAAPGVAVRAAYWGPHPDRPGQTARGSTTISGTSVAAPMVTGSLAAMKHVFRSQLSNTALLARLLATADRTGIYADSATYGRGLLDLDAATAPVGTASITRSSRVGGPGQAAGQTRFAPGGAFGDGMARSLAGQEVAAFDDLGAPFWYGLDGFVRPGRIAPAAARLRSFLAPAPEGAEGADPGGRAPPLAGVAFAAPAPGRKGGPTGSGTRSVRGSGTGFGRAWSTRRPRGPAAAIFRSPTGRWSSPPRRRAASASAPSRPKARPAPGTAGGTAGRRPRARSCPGARPARRWGCAAAWSPSAGPFSAARRRAPSAGCPATPISSASTAARTPAAGGSRPRRRSARRDAAVGGGLLSGLSGLVTSAFALRAERRLDGRDSLRFSASQPLRIEAGRARLSVPAGRTPDGAVLRRSLTAGLAPTGRQIDLSARWRRTLARGGQLRLGADWTLHPDHDAAAPSIVTLMAGWRHRF